MTQKSKQQRERRRRRWYGEERPALLVRLRLVSSPEEVDKLKDTPLRDAHHLRRVVRYYEHLDSLNPPERS